MKEKAALIGCYTFLVFIGGMIGYLSANSLPSLIASSIFGIILSICTTLIWRGNLKAYYVATFVIAFLSIFFTYRFLLTYKIAPAGVMAFISGILFIYLFTQRKKMVLAFEMLSKN